MAKAGLLRGPRGTPAGPPRPTSRRPTAAWPESSTPTSIRATRPPRSASRRSRRPTRSSRTRKSAGPTTGSATPARGRDSGGASTPGRPPGRPGAGGLRGRAAAVRGLPLRGGRPRRPLRKPLRRRARARSRARSRARISRAQIEVPFRDAVLGGTASLALRREQPVSRPAGAPAAPARPSARRARARAWSPSPSACASGFPRARENGGAIRASRQGMRPASAAGSAGDLYVTVRVTPHPYFERQGNDIHGVVPITVKEAYAGAEIDVPTIHGTVRAKVPPGDPEPPEVPPSRPGRQGPADRRRRRSHLHGARDACRRRMTPAGADAATLLDSLYEARRPRGAAEGPSSRLPPDRSRISSAWPSGLTFGQTAAILPFSSIR